MGNSTDVSALISAFNTFESASRTLESYYKGLEKRVEDLNLELAEKNNYLTGLIEALPVGIIVTDNSGRIATVNKLACSILEKAPELLAEEKIENIAGALDRLLMNGKRCMEYETVMTGMDSKKKTISISATILKNLEGYEAGSLIVLKDISEIKRLRESVERDKRLKAMGEMAASIAHQIRNPLGSIELFASILDEDLNDNNASQRFAKEIIHAVKALNNTLSNMLLFANNSRPFKVEVGVDEIIKDTIDTCKFLFIDRNLDIDAGCSGPDIKLSLDKELLKQALLNLIMNGAEAIDNRESGKISIISRQDKDSIHIIVSDNGCGIPENDLEEIFNPFFTLKPKGTGLGLTVVNNIIKAHGGIITLESSIGKGTTFDIALPIG
ncbi:MAG: PAS domain S-box protein [Deltaproteobacteria bacterium]|nr:PAS domain S-box protein [Deltaproteobacteria bacterium]